MEDNRFPSPMPGHAASDCGGTGGALDQEDEGFWKQLHRLFAADDDHLFMDAGPPGSSLKARLDADDSECSSTFADIRCTAARGLGCDPDELVVTQSTTDALCKIIGGLELRAGDEILTTNHEHYGSRAPMALARDRYGVNIRSLTVPVGNRQRCEDYIDLFATNITGRTKVLLFSAPTYTTGTMLPVRMLARLAQQYGLISVVDGAHLPGMLACDLHRFGVDFLAGSGNKWQGAPAGTGILYVRNKVLPAYNPLPLPRFWPLVSIWYPCEEGLPPRTAGETPSYDIAEYLQTIGSVSLSRMVAFGRACEIWDQIGRQHIERRLLGLSAYLKQRIIEHWGELALYSPWQDARLATAISSFTPFRDPADQFDEQRFRAFVARLAREHRITIKHLRFVVPGVAAPVFAVRVCTRLTHTREDIDRLVGAMLALSYDMA